MSYEPGPKDAFVIGRQVTRAGFACREEEQWYKPLVPRMRMVNAQRELRLDG